MQSICLDCQNGYATKCTWVGCGVPIEGTRCKGTSIVHCPNFRSDKEKKTCKVCGKKFDRIGRQIYCSVACRAVAKDEREKAQKETVKTKKEGKRYAK